MGNYSFRKNFSATCSNDMMTIRSKLAFKTKGTDWLNTESQVIVPISIRSTFLAGLAGDLKMQAYTSIIKNHVQGKITILLTEKSHLHVASLKYNPNSYDQALEEETQFAREIESRFRLYFQNCKVEYWETYISNDSHYFIFKEQIDRLYQTDSTFKSLVLHNAEVTYTCERAREFSNKSLFIEKAVKDLLEHCVYMLLIANKGYKYQFYPGSLYSCMDYVNENLIEPEKRVSLVNVCLTIERKTITKTLEGSLLSYNRS